MIDGTLLVDLAPDQDEKSYYFAAACPAGRAVVDDYATTTNALGVTLATGTTAKVSPATADLPGVLGFSVEAVVAGTVGRVRKAGVMTGVLCNAGVTAGMPLCTEATAGSCREFVEGTDGNKVATALTSYSGGTCTVRIGC